jgi:hypothetical protein
MPLLVRAATRAHLTPSLENTIVLPKDEAMGAGNLWLKEMNEDSNENE